MYINYRGLYVRMPEIFLSLHRTKRYPVMIKLLTVWNYVRRHKYMFTLVIFIIVVGFLDENSYLQRIEHQREISALNGEIDRYRKQYEEDTQKLKDLSATPEALEKIAREKYLMKKPNEDIYVFEE